MVFSVLFRRPFFTYWITFVHILITILAVCIYGIAPVGFSQHETVDSVSVAWLYEDSAWLMLYSCCRPSAVCQHTCFFSLHKGPKKQRRLWKCQIRAARELLDWTKFGEFEIWLSGYLKNKIKKSLDALQQVLSRFCVNTVIVCYIKYC